MLNSFIIIILLIVIPQCNHEIVIFQVTLWNNLLTYHFNSTSFILISIRKIMDDY